eukprot:824921-Pyramimonas_sp.AAC.2
MRSETPNQCRMHVAAGFFPLLSVGSTSRRPGEDIQEGGRGEGGGQNERHAIPPQRAQFPTPTTRAVGGRQVPEHPSPVARGPQGRHPSRRRAEHGRARPERRPSSAPVSHVFECLGEQGLSRGGGCSVRGSPGGGKRGGAASPVLHAT